MDRPRSSKSPSTQPGSALEATRGAVRKVVEGWLERHGQVVADVQVVAGNTGPRVTGSVLVPSQRLALAKAVEASVSEVPVEMAVEARTERPAHAEDWCRPSGEHVDVHAAPDGDLSTQWRRDEPPLRRLAERDGWWAVELCDRTVGWTVSEALRPLASDQERPEDVAAWRNAWLGRWREGSLAAWLHALEPWLDVPYRLGGRLREGIDCSALTQILYLEVQGVGLPRHSRDQVRLGNRVARHELDTGDLLYLTHLERGVSHTALHLGHGRLAQVGHASLDHGVVVVESREGLLQRYQLRAARRFEPGGAQGQEGLRPRQAPASRNVAPGS